MSTLTYIIIFSLIGSIGSLIGGLILLTKEKLALKISHFLASFAAGTLLGAAFFDLLPEAAHEAEKHGINIFFWTLAGIVAFFFIERFIHWFHRHDDHHDLEHEEQEKKTTVPLIVISDIVHNFVDGVVIAATFMISIPLGIVTTLSVAAHEIPQEIGDFGLMLHKGVAKRKIILINVLSALAAVIGALLTYALGELLEPYISIFLALTAGFFIYIATSDLIPQIHHEKNFRSAVIQTLLLLAGIAIIAIAVTFLEGGQ